MDELKNRTAQLEQQYRDLTKLILQNNSSSSSDSNCNKANTPDTSSNSIPLLCLGLGLIFGLISGLSLGSASPMRTIFVSIFIIGSILSFGVGYFYSSELWELTAEFEALVLLLCFTDIFWLTNQENYQLTLLGMSWMQILVLCLVAVDKLTDMGASWNEFVHKESQILVSLLEYAGIALQLYCGVGGGIMVRYLLLAMLSDFCSRVSEVLGSVAFLLFRTIFYQYISFQAICIIYELWNHERMNHI